MLKSMKWTKVSKAKLSEYKKFVNIFFAINGAQLNCVLLDHKKINYRKHFRGNKLLAYYRFYFYLLTRNVNFNNFYYIYVHRRETPILDSLTVLKRKVNQYCDKTSAKCSGFWSPTVPTYPVKLLEPRDHKVTEILQLADVLLGGIGYHWNNYHKINPNTAKAALSYYIASKLGLKDLRIVTPKEERLTAKINLWEFPLK